MQVLHRMWLEKKLELREGGGWTKEEERGEELEEFYPPEVQPTAELKRGSRDSCAGKRGKEMGRETAQEGKQA